ncbi:hypothetical protein, partial [Pseudomonas viridiflava]|uniref:hypothetical protein n=1 Tax=Pseudomonas viridiflava TaxID=33069 RepID=UPI0013DF32A6
LKANFIASMHPQRPKEFVGWMLSEGLCSLFMSFLGTFQKQSGMNIVGDGVTVIWRKSKSFTISVCTLFYVAIQYVNAGSVRDPSKG